MPINYYCDVEVQSQVLATDVSNSRVGINLDAPLTTLHVDGIIRAGGGSTSSTRVNLSSSSLSFLSSSTTYGAVFVSSNQFYINTGTSGGTLYIGAPAANTTNLYVQGQATLNTIDNATSDTNKFLVSDSGVIKYRTGDEVRADIGAGTGDGTVTGTGTANYVAKWSDSDTITDSVIYDDGTSVGIGTTSPSYTLDIEKSGANARINSTTSQAVLNLSSQDASNVIIEFGDADDDNVGKIQYTHSNDSMRFITNASEAMRIDSNGDVGIGKTSPGFKLDVESSQANVVRVSSTGDTGGILLVNSGTTDAVAVQSQNDNLQFRVDNGYIDLKTNTGATATSRMRILSDGKVGIGTTNPDGLLHIDGMTRTNAAIVTEASASATNTIMEIQNNGAAKRMTLQYDNTNINFNIADRNDAAIATFREGGNVGIGTTVPSEKLDVNGTVNLTNLKVSTSQGSDGQVLTSTGSGIAWESLPNTTQTILNSNFIDSGSTTLALRIPFNTLTETSSNQYYNHIDCPTDGSVKRFRIQNTSGTMSTSFTTELLIYKNGSTTPTGSGELSIQTDQNGGNYVVWDPSSYTFDEGDKLQFAFQKSASNKLWQGVSASIIIEFDKV